MSGYIGTQPVPQATQTRDAFTCTAGQTSFATSGYTPDYLDVYLNGIKLAAADYTASNGSDVVLASGAALNDILEVVAYTAFEAAHVTGADDFTVTGSFTSQGIDDNATSTAMTLDASGNLLVGRTSDSNSSVGISLRPDGQVSSSRDGNVSFIMNRNTSDGDIAVFQKDGSTVGSIGSSNGDLTLGNSDVGLKFHDTNNTIYPWNVGSDAASDGQLDLGAGSIRFKDLYLSGGVYLGGTGSANKLDDYEEGTWTPQVYSDSTLIGIDSYVNAYYQKVGNTVHLRAHISRSDTSSVSGAIVIKNLPFTVVRTTLSGSFWMNNTGSNRVGSFYVYQPYNGPLLRCDGDSSYILANQWGNGRTIFLTFSYQTSQ